MITAFCSRVENQIYLFSAGNNASFYISNLKYCVISIFQIYIAENLCLYYWSVSDL